MDDGMARVKANGYMAHCRRLLSQIDEQPAWVQAMPMVCDAKILAGQSLELAAELLRRVPAPEGENDGG